MCDLLEEGWHSMDLVGDMLLDHLPATGVEAERIRPDPPQRFSRLPIPGGLGVARNADRLTHRFRDYPNFLRRRADDCDVYHVVDHSYAQLVHDLPAERTVVTCHDLDTFRSVLDPESERSKPFQWMTRYILSGLQKAAVITCDSEATREDLLAHGLCAPERAVVVRNGVHPSCSPDPHPEYDEQAAKLLGPVQGGTIDLLHVGSTIPRKRIDVLLRVFAAIRADWPGARLIRVGGRFTSAQEQLARELRIEDSIVVLPRMDRNVLAAVYRRAALVLQPSEAEGFGLPVSEAMSCGTPVVATDIPVLREVGADGAVYCPMGDIDVWENTITGLLRLRRQEPHEWRLRQVNVRRAGSRFNWFDYAYCMSDIYRKLVSS